MAKTFARRLQQAANIQTGALSTFDKAVEELELAARLSRDTYDDIQAEIDRLTVAADEAQQIGMRAQRRVVKLRELLD